MSRINVDLIDSITRTKPSSFLTARLTLDDDLDEDDDDDDDEDKDDDEDSDEDDDDDDDDDESDEDDDDEPETWQVCQMKNDSAKLQGNLTFRPLTA